MGTEGDSFTLRVDREEVKEEKEHKLGSRHLDLRSDPLAECSTTCSPRKE